MIADTALLVGLYVSYRFGQLALAAYADARSRHDATPAHVAQWLGAGLLFVVAVLLTIDIALAGSGWLSDELGAAGAR